MQFVRPMPFREAVEKLGARSTIGSAMLSSEWQDVPVALRERAFFSSQVENARFLQRAMDAIDAFLEAAREPAPDGSSMLVMGSRAEFVDQMREFALGEGMGPIDESMAGGLRDITSERRLGLIFDTQVRQANDYGYWKQGQDPDVLNEFPAQRFIRVQDVKEPRETHTRFEDQVYLKNDPIWATTINEDFHVPWGPWAWGCGHDVEDVDRDEAESLGLLKPGDQVEPDTKSFNENLRASTNGLEPDLVNKLKAEFGDQLVIEGDEMRWAGETAGTGAAAKEDVATGVERDNPVSDALDLQVSGLLKEKAQAALNAIDKVHDDGELPEIPLKSIAGPEYGNFSMTTAGSGLAAKQIGVRVSSPWPTFTTIHETGHFLDLAAIGEKGKFATLSGDPDMRRVLDAADGTDAIKNLRRLEDETESSGQRSYYRYLLKPQEIWARAYSQFIAERARFNGLDLELKKAQEAENYRQWDAADFAPVGEAIKAMFDKLGWL